jgi:DNA polymerase III epsilon subunit-like protein
MGYMTEDLDRVIVVDLETSGLLPHVCGILSIGATNLTNDEEFYIESRLEDYHEIGETALQVNGFTREECYDDAKPTNIQAVNKFYKWVEVQAASNGTGKKAIIAGHNIIFDINYLKKVRPSWPFIFRSLDAHALGLGVLGVSHSSESLCDALGVEREPEIHNALEGAKMAKRTINALIRKGLYQTSTI